MYVMTVRMFMRCARWFYTTVRAWLAVCGQPSVGGIVYIYIPVLWMSVDRTYRIFLGFDSCVLVLNGAEWSEAHNNIVCMGCLVANTRK